MLGKLERVDAVSKVFKRLPGIAEIEPFYDLLPNHASIDDFGQWLDEGAQSMVSEGELVSEGPIDMFSGDKILVVGGMIEDEMLVKGTGTPRYFVGIVTSYDFHKGEIKVLGRSANNQDTVEIKFECMVESLVWGIFDKPKLENK